MLDIASIKPI